MERRFCCGRGCLWRGQRDCTMHASFETLVLFTLSSCLLLGHGLCIAIPLYLPIVLRVNAGGVGALLW